MNIKTIGKVPVSGVLHKNVALITAKITTTSPPNPVRTLFSENFGPQLPHHVFASNQWIVTTSASGDIRVRQWQGNEDQENIGPSVNLSKLNVAISEGVIHNNLLITTSQDWTLRIWDLETKTLLKSFSVSPVTMPRFLTLDKDSHLYFVRERQLMAKEINFASLDAMTERELCVSDNHISQLLVSSTHLAFATATSLTIVQKDSPEKKWNIPASQTQMHFSATGDLYFTSQNSENTATLNKWTPSTPLESQTLHTFKGIISSFQVTSTQLILSFYENKLAILPLEGEPIQAEIKASAFQKIYQGPHDEIIGLDFGNKLVWIKEGIPHKVTERLIQPPQCLNYGQLLGCALNKIATIF